MKSIDLLPELEVLPSEALPDSISTSELVSKLVEMDNDHFAIESSLGAEKVLMGIFDAYNVPDQLTEAYEKTFTATDLSLVEKYNECLNNGEGSAVGLVSALKGKMAELQCCEMLEHHYPGFNFDLATDPTQPVWDIHGVSADRMHDVLVQVKVVGEQYANELVERMHDAPDVVFALSHEVFQKISAVHPELAGQMFDMHLPILEYTEDVQEALASLADHMGIDLPDEIGDVLPYVGEIVLGIRLVCDIISVERDFSNIHMDDRKKIHVVKALALISRFGISTVCGVLGTAAGTIVFPGIGSLLGGLGGIGLSMYLNYALKPHILEIALDVCELTTDDLFYFKNKVVIDDLGSSLAVTSV